MIDNDKFEEAKQYLHLEELYPLLHESSKEKINDILSERSQIR